MADFHIAAVGNVQAGPVVAFIADAAHVRRAVALAHDQVVLFFHLRTGFFGQALAGNKGHFQKEILTQIKAFFFGLLRQVHEKTGRAHIAGNAQLLHDVQLGGGVRGPGRDDRAAQVAQGLFKHEARRGQLVVEGVLHRVAGPEAHGVEGLRIPPVVFATVFGVENGTGGKKNTLEFANVLGQQPTQTRSHRLQKDKFLLFQNGNVLDVRERLELFHIELRTVEAFFYVFGIAVRIGEQLLELNKAVLATFAFVQHFATAENAFGAVFTGHSYSTRA